MRVVVYPADRWACGHFRMIWPGELLAAAGHDVTVVRAEDRHVDIVMQGETVVDVRVEADVVVFQRLTHQWMADAVPILRSKGVAVVVDVDDDLNRIHPANPAYRALHPDNLGRGRHGNRHSWIHLNRACRDATLVTVSTPALLDVYARHGRGHVLHNYLPDHYYDVPHVDSAVLGWPASLHSHPNDPAVVGDAVARLVGEGATFRTVGDPRGAGPAFELPCDPPGAAVEMEDWPAAVASLGVGMAPLADTAFNRAKSWLKPLEMSALGVPWVASPRAEYAALHRLGAGMLADTPRRWHRSLRRLTGSETARKEQAEANRQVAENLRLRDHAGLWMEAWERALHIQRVPGP